MKRYVDMMMEILSFDVEDVIRTSSIYGKPDDSQDNLGDIGDMPFIPGM